MEYINGETVGIILFFIGIWGLVSKKNIMKSIISIGIIETGIILFFLADKSHGKTPPIGDFSNNISVFDPLPQALMITEVVIGTGITAATLIMFIHLYHKYGTADWNKIKKIK